ncbi:MAG: response regulator [Bacteroidales bacterium]|nr:response regulator [Bacteroidales bacterium]MCM1416592.1 response regulator [bacterium]MCM1422860.1 response regulator [bacterium]
MKYKILLTGNNKMIINEFFTYMDFSFECLSTSDRYDDIVNHVKYIQPDALVYCLYGENPDDLKRFVNVERKIAENRIPIIVVGDGDECDQFERIAPSMEVTMFRKPISSQKLEEGIVELLKKKRPHAGEASRSVTVKKDDIKAKDVMRVAEQLLAEIAKEEEKEKAEQAEAERKKHILVVDDDSSVLKLLKGYLAERYDVATAISGKIAMKFLETKKTDMVLLDYEMPVENGAAVLTKIRENQATEKLPVVFLTGVTDRQKILEVLALKPQGYLTKPIDMEKLSSTIKGVLG